MYSGQIQSTGPRYCPSIEDKVVRFAEKESHQVFLEQEGWETNQLYVQGMSTSLPADVQDVIVRSMPGCARAHIHRYGYAVEYDMVRPHQIYATGMTKRVDGLFLAGQINGTSGYEEAAGQGLIAGINAARKVQGREPVTLTRDQAYIGVMIDDLITKTPTEPYRMFTSRAEFRLSLRSDNADQRLTPVGQAIGLAEPARINLLAAKLGAMTDLAVRLKGLKLPIGGSGTTAYDFLRRPDVTIADVQARLGNEAARWPVAVWQQVEIEAKYAGYIEREKAMAARMRELEDKRIPSGFDFTGMSELRTEAKQCLEKFRPGTVGQASRLEGITPSDLTVLMIYLQGKKR
jgi:tRNA uridine 5-carboxymethylaminomethyl modification enzyme